MQGTSCEVHHNSNEYNMHLEILTNYCVCLASRLSQSTLVRFSHTRNNVCGLGCPQNNKILLFITFTGLKARIRPVITDLDTEVYFYQVYDGSRVQNTQLSPWKWRHLEPTLSWCSFYHRFFSLSFAKLKLHLNPLGQKYFQGSDCPVQKDSYILL